MATLLGFAAIFMWGMLAALSVYTNKIPPFQLLFICFSIAASIVFVKRLIQKQPVFKAPSMDRTQWLVGVAGLFGFHIFYFLALRFAPPIEATLIIYLWPLILGIIVATKGTKGFALLGGLIGFSGTAMIIANGLDFSNEINIRTLIGYLFGFFCAIIWSLYSWFLSRTKSDVEDIAWVSLVVALIALVCHLVFEQGYWAFTGVELFMLAIIGLGPTGGAFYLWDIGMKKGNRSWLASLSFTTPIISSLALFVFGFSDLTIVIALAATLIVFGALISNIASFKKKQP